MHRLRQWALYLVAAISWSETSALDNGVGRVPFMGWTSWQPTIDFAVNASDLLAAADSLEASGLREIGYEYILIDDGWPACQVYGENGRCDVPPARLDDGTVIVDIKKFPESTLGANDGIKLVADKLHAKGFKIGIYTAPHGQTCGGYWGMLGHERTDAAMFAGWGIDFVKLDLGCRSDTSIHDGTAIAALERVRDGLNATGRPILFYIDAGNPTAGPRVYNPQHRGMPNNLFTQTHVANALSEAVWSWGPNVAHSWKIWFDRSDSWHSVIENVYRQVGLEWFQGPGQIHNPDMLTIGRGAMADGEYRVEMFLYAILGAPLVLSFDPKTIDSVPIAKTLLLNKGIVAVNQDPDAVQGSLIPMPMNPAGTDVWIKPLSTGEFAVALINRDDTNAHPIAVILDGSTTGSFYAGPRGGHALVTDVESGQNLGNFTADFTTTVPPHDGRLVLIKFY
eukprot:m.152325 g.152325  ORF g.152325 m.152325 type:complete len:452 (+) comp14318_c0_seq2:3577-4932(+)